MPMLSLLKRFNIKLLLLVIFHCLFFTYYQYINKAYQTWDSAGHISLSFRMANEITGIINKTPNTSIENLMTISNYYPPLIQFIGAFFSLAFGYSSENILLISLVFFVLCIVFTYKLALHLSKNEQLAFYTAAIFSFFPEVIEQSRVFHLDLPLVALLLMAIYFLLKSESLSKIGYSVMFFVFAALGQITKWYAGIYLLLPFIFVVAPAFKSSVVVKKTLLNMLIGTVIVLAICTPWYYLNYADLLRFSKIFATPESDDPTGLLSLANLIFYPSSVLTYQTLFLPFIAMLAGIVAMYLRDRKQFWYLFSYLILSPLVFLVIANKNLRYVLPLSPLFAYFIAYFLFSLRPKWQWLKFVLVAYLIAGTMFLTFNKMTARQKGLLPISYAFVGPNYKSWYEIEPSFYGYDSNHYQIGEMLDYIYKDANKFGKNPLGIANLSDSQKFSAATLEMLRLEKHMNNVYLPVPYFQFVPFGNDLEMDEFLTNSGAEYVIAPSWVGPSGLRNYAALTQMVEYLNSTRNVNYTKINTFNLPDGTKVGIFKRNGVVQKFLAPGECTDKAGFLDGIETIKLTPNTTYVLFTGHFAIQEKILRNYEQGVVYVVQIENTIHSSYLDVHNLPRNGATMCARAGIGHDITSEVTLPVRAEGQCGVNCTKSVHVLWNVGDPEPKITEYKRGEI